ncbi:MAG: hypothetical protein AAF658_18090, partial [Myxococcota bacterium]
EKIDSSDVAGAPVPESAAGLVEAPDETNAVLWVPRVVFFPLRVAFLVPGYLVEGIGYAADRYRLKSLAQSIFFNEDGTFGIFPTVIFQSGFGVNYGARLQYRDIFGHRERLALSVGYGGQFQQVYTGSFKTGEAFGDRLSLEVRGRYEQQPIARFFGIGNRGELLELEDFAPQPAIDAVDESIFVDTRYGEERAVGRLQISYRVAGSLFVQLQSKLDYRNFESLSDDRTDDDLSTDAVFDTASLPAYDVGQRNVLNQVSVVFDNTKPRNRFISRAAPSSGFRLEGFAGYLSGFGDDPSNTWRLGTDLTWIVDLYNGDRTLVLHYNMVGVTSDLNEVPFTNLPTIGGTLLLRGFNPGRFRDRVAAVGSAEYQYPLNSYAKAYAFVDAGRVWRRLSNFSVDELNVGYGFGFQLHSPNSFLMRFDVSGSVDGVRVALSFNPLYEDSPTKRL